MDELRSSGFGAEGASSFEWQASASGWPGPSIHTVQSTPALKLPRGAAAGTLIIRTTSVRRGLTKTKRALFARVLLSSKYPYMPDL